MRKFRRFFAFRVSRGNRVIPSQVQFGILKLNMDSPANWQLQDSSTCHLAMPSDIAHLNFLILKMRDPEKPYGGGWAACIAPLDTAD